MYSQLRLLPRLNPHSLLSRMAAVSSLMSSSIITMLLPHLRLLRPLLLLRFSRKIRLLPSLSSPLRLCSRRLSRPLRLLQPPPRLLPRPRLQLLHPRRLLKSPLFPCLMP